MPVHDLYSDYDFTMLVIFRSEFCFSLMFRSMFLLPADRDAICIFGTRPFSLHLTTCQIVAKKGRHTKRTINLRTTQTSKLWLQEEYKRRKLGQQMWSSAIYKKDYHDTWPFFFFFVVGSHLAMSRKLLRDYAALLGDLQSPIKWYNFFNGPFLGPS